MKKSNFGITRIDVVKSGGAAVLGVFLTGTMGIKQRCISIKNHCCGPIEGFLSTGSDSMADLPKGVSTIQGIMLREAADNGSPCTITGWTPVYYVPKVTVSGWDHRNRQVGTSTDPSDPKGGEPLMHGTTNYGVFVYVKS